MNLNDTYTTKTKRWIIDDFFSRRFLKPSRIKFLESFFSAVRKKFNMDGLIKPFGNVNFHMVLFKLSEIL
jgi:hypothetical protein